MFGARYLDFLIFVNRQFRSGGRWMISFGGESEIVGPGFKRGCGFVLFRGTGERFDRRGSEEEGS